MVISEDQGSVTTSLSDSESVPFAGSAPTSLTLQCLLSMVCWTLTAFEIPSNERFTFNIYHNPVLLGPTTS